MGSGLREQRVYVWQALEKVFNNAGNIILLEKVLWNDTFSDKINDLVQAYSVWQLISEVLWKTVKGNGGCETLRGFTTHLISRKQQVGILVTCLRLEVRGSYGSECILLLSSTRRVYAIIELVSHLLQRHNICCMVM